MLLDDVTHMRYNGTQNMRGSVQRTLPRSMGDVLKVAVKKIDKKSDELVVIQCHELTDDVKNIVNYVKSVGASLAGYVDDKVSQIALQDIFIVEAVNNRVFAYTKAKVYELKCKLYEFETLYENRGFFRCSKSFIVNLMKIDHVRPILNGRFCATMFNKEEVIISRQYVPDLKKRLLGDHL